MNANRTITVRRLRPYRHRGRAAMAFYGGLGDLLATAAIPGWTSADKVTIAYGLNSWQPTPGTLASGKVSKQRRQGHRIAYRNGRLELREHLFVPGAKHVPYPRRSYAGRVARAG